MRTVLLFAIAAVGFALSDGARAQSPAPPVPGTLHVIRAGEAIVKPMAEWEVGETGAGEQTGHRVLIAEGREAVDKAPPDASRYEARAYKFPTGTIRVLTFPKQTAGVVHQITYETELYVLKGSVSVDIRGKPVTLQAGDAAFLPGGVMRNKRPTAETVVVQYFVGHTAQQPSAQVVRSKDLKPTSIVQWLADGKAISAATPAEAKNAPSDAARYEVKRYVFDGNSIRHAALHKGGRTPPNVQGRTDALIYVTKGRLRRTEGSEVFEVTAGDALREEVGQTGHWEILEESAFLGSDAPRPLAVSSPAPSGR
jgi:quercetin dioxygenase-like cupin family protein